MYSKYLHENLTFIFEINFNYTLILCFALKIVVCKMLTLKDTVHLFFISHLSAQFILNRSLETETEFPKQPLVSIVHKSL